MPIGKNEIATIYYHDHHASMRLKTAVVSTYCCIAPDSGWTSVYPTSITRCRMFILLLFQGQELSLETVPSLLPVGQYGIASLPSLSDRDSDISTPP